MRLIARRNKRICELVLSKSRYGRIHLYGPKGPKRIRPESKEIQLNKGVRNSMGSLSDARGVFAMLCMVEGKTCAGGLGGKTARPACPGLLADELVIVGSAWVPIQNHSTPSPASTAKAR
jgi:hypothetical protein